jgi:GNAT superfamily N-acetyltransferase
MQLRRTSVTGHEEAVTDLTAAYFREANRLGRDWFDDDEYGVDIPEITDADIERLRDAEPPEPLFLVSGEDTIAGMGQLHRHDETTVTAKRIFVRQAFRGNGLGRALVEEMIAGAADDGFERLHLNASPYHQRARGLYETLGFEAVPTPSWTQVSPELHDDWYFFELSLGEWQSGEETGAGEK